MAIVIKQTKYIICVICMCVSVYVNRTIRLIKTLGAAIVSGSVGWIIPTHTRAVRAFRPNAEWACSRACLWVGCGRFIASASATLSRVSVQNHCRHCRWSSGFASKPVRLTCRILAKTRPAHINHGWRWRRWRSVVMIWL